MKQHLGLPEERPRLHFDGAVLLLTAVALLSLILYLNMRDLLRLPALPDAPNQTWLERDPLQCRGNPWEMDWERVQANLLPACQPVCNQPDAPGCTTSCQVIAYYQSLGITIHSTGRIDFATKFKKPVELCEACSCPAGYTLYVRVADQDVERMLALGFRRVIRNCGDLPAAERPYGCE